VDEMQARYPLHQFRRAAKIMKEVRAIKSPLEIEVVKQAVDITHKTFRRVMQFVRPGVMEYEIHAEIVHSFISQRADGEAYGSIIASGDNARTLHYVSNNDACKDGDLVLMDFGAAYGGYAADLSRTIPANGTFTERQKEIYNACLHLHNYAKSLLKPLAFALKIMFGLQRMATLICLKAFPSLLKKLRRQ
jgi:Xaa-Pro aminopeptidase